MPIYDISANGRIGHRLLELGNARYFVAEGIFAAELVGACAGRRACWSWRSAYAARAG